MAEKKGAGGGGGGKASGSRGSMSIIGDAILAETIKKELRHFVLNEKYMLSPNAIKNLVFTNKPTDRLVSVDSSEEPEAGEAEDEVSLVGHAKPKTPRTNNDTPATTSGIYGWDTKPLVRITDRRFYHPKTVTEITKKYGTSVAPGSKAVAAKAGGSGGAA
ncbi:FAM183A and FAM183B related-domain-containing protein [Entophlyctis helioformis]|nr:FAM183A and FAM183B related-domain-containing protein [Entophlyctis helioformis]